MAATNVNQLETWRARLAEFPTDLAARVDALRHDATRRAQIVVGESRDRGLEVVFGASATALDAAATLGRALPFATRLGDELEQRAQRLTARGAALAQPPIENYDELNVKEVCAKLEGLDAWQLTRVKRYEEAHKQRKTVLGALTRLLS